MVQASRSLIDELEHTVADKKLRERAAILRRVADLFVATSERLSEEQIALFDDVMRTLLQEIETSARAAFGQVLAMNPIAPPGIGRTLAFDDTSEVAGPILSHSETLDEATLVEGAKTESQQHLPAISRRKILNEPITDVLVERGVQQVVRNTPENPGVIFSEFGFSTLVQRSLDDDELAIRIWVRAEIPRQHGLKLFLVASEAVKQKLTNVDSSKSSMILEIVAHAMRQIQARARSNSASYVRAYSHVKNLESDGKLDEAKLTEFATAGKFDETAVALCSMCDLPISMVERIFAEERFELLIVIAKANGISWDTVKSILRFRPDTGQGARPTVGSFLEDFTRLKPDTAKKAMNFYRLRERSTDPDLSLPETRSQ